MNKDTHLLREAFTQFVSHFPQFGYPYRDLQLWILSQEEYAGCYLQAAGRLSLVSQASTEELTKSAGNFCAEILKNPSQCIILLNRELSNLGAETKKILVHELAHAFCYQENSGRQPSVTPSTDPRTALCLSYGEQLWNEFAAELLTERALGQYEKKSTDTLRKTFLSLMYDMAQFPSRLGFFLLDCHFLSPGLRTAGDLLQIPDQDEIGQDLLRTLEVMRQLLFRKSAEPEFWIRDTDFLILLGKSMVAFSYRYLSYFDHIDAFLTEETS